MSHKVIVLKSALADIESIYEYIELNDSEAKANFVLEEIENKINSLGNLPSRGRQVEELSSQGLNNFNIRQISFKPYRVIYRIENDMVIVLLVLDGRRDLDDLILSRMMNL